MKGNEKKKMQNKKIMTMKKIIKLEKDEMANYKRSYQHLQEIWYHLHHKSNIALIINTLLSLKQILF